MFKPGWLLSVLLACSTAMAAEHSAGEEGVEAPFRYGGDIRFRTTFFDNIPRSDGQEARGGNHLFQQYRFRLWAEHQATDQIALHGRLLNEFRTYTRPDNRSWKAPDELVIDNLYVDWAGPGWTVRIGRQDLRYGTGKILLDGTPKDGSRTLYFDAVKVTCNRIENNTIDLLLLHTRAKDPLALRSRGRDLTGFSGSNEYRGTESGGGLYLKNKAFDALPFESYYLVKTREQSVSFLPESGTRHTVGFRLMPVWSDTLDSNLETAYQFGNRISAYMVDACLNWNVPVLADLDGRLTAGWYHLSGDKPGTERDEGWNPLWSRWPQYSELYVYAYDLNGAGRWSNLSMPRLETAFSPHSKIRTHLMAAWLLAPEDDGPGGGHQRGFLLTCWNRFTLKEKLISSRDRLAGHLLIEAFEPGNYYLPEQQRTALFVRAELSYSF